MAKHTKVKDLAKANAIITDYVNGVCAEILYNTAVFKKDNKGVIAFNEFMYSCGLKSVK